MRPLLPLAAITAFLLCSSALANTLYLDPAAPPGGDGSFARPFRTIDQSRDAVRKLRAAGKLPPGRITILLRGGDYRIVSSITFDETDSGEMDAPIVYRAAAGERPRLIGGVTLDDVRFEPVDDKAVLSRLPDEAARRYVRRIDLAAGGGRGRLEDRARPSSPSRRRCSSTANRSRAPAGPTPMPTAAVSRTSRK